MNFMNLKFSDKSIIWLQIDFKSINHKLRPEGGGGVGKKMPPKWPNLQKIAYFLPKNPKYDLKSKKKK